MVKAFPETSTSIRVSWQPPPQNKRNGKIIYYKIFYVKSTRSDPEATMIEIEKDKLTDYEFTIDELLKYTEYRLWMLAGTSVGDGPISYPIIVKTDEDGTYQFYFFKTHFLCFIQKYSIRTKTSKHYLVQFIQIIQFNITSNYTFITALTKT